jgi:hypothetical protein
MAYYPGCTLKTTGKGLEKSALASAKALGIELVELDRWNCCGTVHSLASDNIINNIGAARNLIRTKQSGYDKFVTLCSICYNTQKSVNDIFKKDREKRDKINAYMYEEPDYEADVEVLHLLEVIRDHVGFDGVASKVVKPLSTLKIVPYYGCLLLRPKEIAFDSQGKGSSSQYRRRSLMIHSRPSAAAHTTRLPRSGSWLTTHTGFFALPQRGVLTAFARPVRCASSTSTEGRRKLPRNIRISNRFRFSTSPSYCALRSDWVKSPANSTSTTSTHGRS